MPVSGVDTHLPAVCDGELTLHALQRRFQRRPPWQPEWTGDGRVFDRPWAPASVLVPLVQRPGGMHLLLTRRTDHLRDHAGQISFPGGRAEAHDADAVATALREANEEIGLNPDQVDVLGSLPVYTTITAYRVTPVVAIVRPVHPMPIDAFEVAEVFEVPMAFLMNPAHHRRHAVEVAGQRREFLSMPWTGPGADGVEREYFIWGATAAMLRNLYGFLSA